MKRRPPSLRRVAVEGRCPGFNGTIRTLRLPAAHPAALRCLRLAVPPLRRLFAPAGGRRAAIGPGCLVTRPSHTPRSVVGGGRISQVPAQALLPSRTCSFDPGQTARNLPWRSDTARPRIPERPWLCRWTFRGSIAWLGGSLSTLQSAGLPRRDARLASGCAATLCRVGFAPTGPALKSFRSVFSSHRFLLSRAYLAQSGVSRPSLKYCNYS